MRTASYIGIALMIIGFLMASRMLVTLVIDASAPVIDGTIPRNGETYTSLTEFWVSCHDAESGISSVTGLLDSSNKLYYSYYMGDPYVSASYMCTAPTLPSGTHTLTVTIKNGASLIASQTVNFEIYNELLGEWFINDQRITSSLDKIVSTEYTVTFKFVKTSGPDDSKITASASWSGPETGSVQLQRISAGVWTATKTFSRGGSYSVTLKASDGQKDITFSVITLDLGWVLPQFDWKQIFGMALIAVGAIILARSAKSR